jgi:hypothetical protein
LDGFLLYMIVANKVIEVVGCQVGHRPAVGKFGLRPGRSWLVSLQYVAKGGS